MLDDARPGTEIHQSFGTTLIRTTPPDAQVVATGEFDLATTPTLTAMLSQAVADGCRRFLIDMGGVTFCDASTIGVLVSLDQRLRSDGGSLSIHEASACVRRLFHLVGLDGLLEADDRVVTVEDVTAS